MATSRTDSCKLCGIELKTYEDKICLHNLPGKPASCLYHKYCFKCTVCQKQLSIQNYFLSSSKNFYCAIHCDYENHCSKSSIAKQLKSFKGYSKDKLNLLLHNISPYASPRDAQPKTRYMKTNDDSQIRNELYCFCRNNDIITSTEGYWIECITKECKENNCIRQKNAMVFKDATHKLSDKPFELEQYNEQIYELLFKGKEHWNYYAVDNDINSVILSLKQEYLNSKEYFRILVRSSSHIVEGLLPTSCICANKYSRTEVVNAITRELKLTDSLKPFLDDKTEEKLCNLDRIMHKSEFKVGLLFIKDGQTTEEQFFTNTEHTEEFEEFLKFLGEMVQLKGFTGFNGGLDTHHDLTGEKAIFTRWNDNEIMFHVSTLLPADEHDDQKLQRKRHIGNDIVCIVYLSSPSATFNPGAIKSNFLHIYIVIRPIISNDGHLNYQVAVVSKSLVVPYGPPLPTNCCFSKNEAFKNWLITKIINGERASYRSPKFSAMQERTRRQMLDELINDETNHETINIKPKEKTSPLQKFFNQSKQNGRPNPVGPNKKGILYPDWMQQRFDDTENFQKDLITAFNGIFLQVYDVSFAVGMSTKKSLPAVKSILSAKSRIFYEMFYNTLESHSAKSSPSCSPSTRRKEALSKTISSPVMSAGLKKKLSFEGLKRRSQSFKKDEEIECTTRYGISEYLVTEFEPEEFHVFLQYLHTGMCVIYPEILPSLLSIADHYEVLPLARSCIAAFDDIVNIYNVCPLLVSTHKFSKKYLMAKELQMKILQYITKRAADIFSVFDIASVTEECLSLILSLDLKVKEAEKLNVATNWLERNFENEIYDPNFQPKNQLFNLINFKKINSETSFRNCKTADCFENSS